MKELKFRVWLGSENRFDYNPVIVGGEAYHTEYGNLTGSYPNAIIEQFTGCKDSDDKDVYEGDILECDDIWTFKLGVVSFKRGGFVLQANRQCYELRLFYDLMGCEFKVVGNIHKNPHLIREEK